LRCHGAEPTTTRHRLRVEQQGRKAIVADVLAGASIVVYLTELDEAARAEALRIAWVHEDGKNFNLSPKADIG
jgi:hypothetical protein